MTKGKSNEVEKHKTKEVLLEAELGELPPRAAKLQLSHGMLVEMFRTMCTIRHFEYMADKLYAMGKVHGTMHLSAGQEAVAVGTARAVRPDDYLINHHRGHGHFISKGADIKLMMAEFLGKDTGYCRGRGGSMHIADFSSNSLGANGIVGAGIPHAVGVGLALQMQKRDQIVVFIEHKQLYKIKGQVPEGEYMIPFGLAEVKRPGKDLTVVANNVMVLRSLAVAERLAQEGVDVEVIDPRTLLPLDTQTIINSVIKTGRLLVVHEACQTGGWAGKVIAAVTGSRAFDYLDAPVRRLAGKDVPIPYNRVLERSAVPQEEDIEREIRSILAGKY